MPLILTSILFNFLIGKELSSYHGKTENRLQAKTLVIFGIIANISLLFYYKYTGFFLQNINAITGNDLKILNIVLPLGISFFTFTQIAYLVDAYKGQVKEMDYLNYSLFVTFFPHLIAGPILHHSEMMPQFDSKKTKLLNYKNIAKGIFIFAIGLFKKVIIADQFAIWANAGFGNADSLSFITGWITSLSYTFQLYFDFSGYTDMALGIALLFNIILPINFNSPYIAQNIQDFWRRWHITLSRFLKDYIYIPLGGNKKGEARLYSNLFITFLIGGIWHGASWTYVLWGALHGLALVIHRIWQKFNIKMNKIVAWLITFNFINICWVFFRAKTFNEALSVLEAMLGLKGFMLFNFLQNKLAFLENYNIKFQNILIDVQADKFIFIWLILVWFLIFYKNSIQMLNEFKPTWKTAIFSGLLVIVGILNLNKISEFLYFQF